MKRSGTSLLLGALIAASSATLAHAELSLIQTINTGTLGFSGLGGGGGLTVDGNGNLIFGTNSHTVVTYNPNTDTTVSSFNSPAGDRVVSTAIAPNGTLWLALDGYSGVYSYNQSTSTALYYSASQAGFGWHNSDQVTVDSSGAVYVANFCCSANGGDIIKFQPNANPATQGAFASYQAFNTYAATGYTGPEGVGIDKNGNVWFSQGNGVVGEFNFNNVSAGVTYTQSLGTGYSTYGQFANDGNGDLYVTADGGVFKLNASTGVWSNYLTPGVSSATGLAFDAAGHMFVGNVNTVYEYAAPTPEPSTIGLGALALAGFVALKKRRFSSAR